MHARETALDELSHLLGDHHDCQVIRDIAAGAPHTLGGELEVRKVDALLVAKQTDLARKAHPLAMRLYAERPADSTRQLRRYWQAAVA